VGLAMVKKEYSTARRGFLTKLWIWLGGVALLQFLTGSLLFIFSGKNKQISQKQQSVVVGLESVFQPGSVTFIAEGNFYLSCQDDGGFLAISRKCTHLGCMIPWVEEHKQFECPCHTSVFDSRGDVLKAPAPRALNLYPVSFESNKIIVDIGKSVRRSTFHSEQLAYYVQGTEAE
jgi:cytochrome b6-f complex iron-sulfur subunit